MRKPSLCICENNDADQLRGNCEADQRLRFRYIDSTIPLLSNSEISSLLPFSVAVQPGLCRTRSETRMLVFSRRGSNTLLFWYTCISVILPYVCLVFVLSMFAEITTILLLLAHIFSEVCCEV